VSEEQEFIQELRSNYEKAGWSVGNITNGRDELGFEPDLLLHRGNEHLVVEVKKEGFVSTRATRLIKDLIETKPGWKFELKFIPSNRRRSAHYVDTSNIRKRLDLAKMLQSQGSYSEAFILAWTSVEATLRALFDTQVQQEQQDIFSPSALFTKGYEDGLIYDNELRQLKRGIQARNRVVHGLSVDNIEGESSEILHIAEHLLDRVSEP
jgi:REase_AHJR-like